MKICASSSVCCELIFYILICCSLRGNCQVPEVSQEGLLQPFLTYADVTLFHFHIPEEVTHVTWEFAAFMDDPDCPIRDVHILVQHGSYPVISNDNISLPNNLYLERAALHQLTAKSAFQPADATILPVHNPLPGSWFAAAYIPHWDEQMQQEGLIHKCRYSLGSVAMWSQQDQIRTLNVATTQTVHTLQTTSYFRFYVPSHTWFLLVNITNCHITERPIDAASGDPLFRWCIHSLALNARSLPSPDNPGAVWNISESGGHSFVDRRPFSDGYYYLLVMTEGETQVDVTVTTKECGGAFKNPRPTIRRDVQSLFNSSEEVMDELTKNLSSKNPTISISSSYSLVSDSSDINTYDEYEEHQCFPVLPLARIKHASDFTDTFLIQGSNWYSTWVTVHSTSPLYTHLTLLPFTDIGGSLSIAIHLDELLMNSTHLVISVLGCVRKGRPPPVGAENVLSCTDEPLRLNITSESGDTIEDSVLVPFPEPDIWYLALQTMCYNAGIVTPCVVDQVLVSVDIRVQPCVFTGELPCGDHGTCLETHRGMFFVTSCQCADGWTGLGCHDGSAAQGWGSVVRGVCLLTLSNVFFVPAVVVAVKRRLYAEALLIAATMAASVLYHACDNEVVSYCIARYDVLQFTDFFFSLLCFWMTVVSLVDLGPIWTPVGQTLGVILIAPLVQFSRTALFSFVGPMAVAAAIPLCHTVYQRWKFGTWPSVKRRNVALRFIGIVFAVFGLLIFALVQTKQNYKYIHSTWHMVIALALVFLLPSHRHACQVPVLSSNPPWQLPEDAEMLDISFTVESVNSAPTVLPASSDVDFLLNDCS